MALSLASVYLLYLTVDMITEYFYETDNVELAIVSNLSLAFILYFLVRAGNQKLNQLKSDDYGFGLSGALKNFSVGVLICCCIVFMILFIAFFFGDRIDFIGLEEGYGISLVELILANLVVGAWEEIYFRGFVFNTLIKNNFSFQTSVLITTGFFTITHYGSYDMAQTTQFWFVGVFFISMILAYLYVLTKSIWVPIGFHFFWDLLFDTLNPEENTFGGIKMENYLRDSILIDNISLAVLGVTLAVLIILIRRKSNAALIQSYVLGIQGIR